MMWRMRPDRAERAEHQRVSENPVGENGAVQLDIVAALRFCGLGFDFTRMTELRRRALRPPAEAVR